MPVFQGVLRKMASHWQEPVQYSLLLDEQRVPLNALLGKSLTLSFSGQIFCLHCGKKTNKSYGQGYCYPHFMSLAQNDSCIMSPEKCHWQQGTCREPEWGDAFCRQSHYVYLANASGLKVGITRMTQLPTRWIDQGAAQAMVIARVSERRLAGELEVLLAQQVSDKTNWRRMLAGEPEPLDLAAERDRLYQQLQAQIEALLAQYGPASMEWILHAELQNIHYPVEHYPAVSKSINPDKQREVSGRLLGVKGQYLILDTGVINIRRCGGYQAHLIFED